jgi:hypothetical protein
MAREATGKQAELLLIINLPWTNRGAFHRISFQYEDTETGYSSAYSD